MKNLNELMDNAKTIYSTRRTLEDVFNGIDGITVERVTEHTQSSMDSWLPHCWYTVKLWIISGNREISEEFTFDHTGNGVFFRDDFSGSAVWGRLDDGTFSDHAVSAFSPDNEDKWLDRNGNGEF